MICNNIRIIKGGCLVHYAFKTKPLPQQREGATFNAKSRELEVEDADSFLNNKNSKKHEYSYDLQNHLTAKDGQAHICDKSGNLLSDGESTYEYNAQNKLAKGANAKGETSEYTCHALDVRTQMDVL